jgi:hypothetical protein
MKVAEEQNARLLFLPLDRALGGVPNQVGVAINSRNENSGRADSERKVSRRA